MQRNFKECLLSQCSMKQKFKLLDVELVSKGKENGTEFVMVDLTVLNTFFGLVLCPKCSTKSMTVKGRKWRVWVVFKAHALL